MPLLSDGRVKRNPMITPFLLFAVGLGLVAWYGAEWYELPRYGEADINASVEANLAIDLGRLGRTPEAAQLERLRAQIRAEVEADIRKERSESERGLGVGLLCLVLALGHTVLVRGLSRA